MKPWLSDGDLCSCPNGDGKGLTRATAEERADPTTTRRAPPANQHWLKEDGSVGDAIRVWATAGCESALAVVAAAVQLAAHSPFPVENEPAFPVKAAV